ncbi:MAG TPA: bifunctional phosphopantothenoylcysteine decarboxylase/phosphopantothenate--cysteine ligase CoaBC [Candidatus Latescibacteria bacterium]|jgi:phosphopantothenoylcysteine decarboxylase/phosphopantothenate--cysteine ligase|nr:bifunctional phosphopantothenoylcysteine decarboxylase/phosphopantothenate--cysteine ligase CoaBC [Gemmatimonadota bacterium]MDP7631918.1 bifunctional phosphopantothenoylcysteine decarboxylase/phosphopantothenate--cysteine ligase CoaBC [Candidatus Latescibacterota bacterium]HJN30305.1 bifunctional phosphopantothenoylcysteine decarboxylase/phosphopantothenate--cysteine ligase CoaBC [Candidatus Latescibacterota bacterium]
MTLQDRHILLGITGGIAAYKAPLLIRRLLECGAKVRVVRTATAEQFVTDTTLSVLSQHPVSADLFAPTDEFPVLHVGLAEWADLFLVAPATAHTLGKMAHGLADDLLTCVYLATQAPTMVAPAMEEHMLQHPQVVANCQRLRQQGVGWIEPATGPLASGASGKGRMADIEQIIADVESNLASQADSNSTQDLQGRRLLVTAGPTLEDLDPVRFIGNRSTGKMGYAIAEQARRRGASVHLVSGPTQLPVPDGVEFVGVRSALDMLQACESAFEGVDAAIMAAAVADFRPATSSQTKMKRDAGIKPIELVENPDIAATLGARKGKRVLIAFAMETGQGVDEARGKLKKKSADLVVLNNLQQEGAGFAVDTNIVSFVDSKREATLPLLEKHEVADRILDEVTDLLQRVL